MGSRKLSVVSSRLRMSGEMIPSSAGLSASAGVRDWRDRSTSASSSRDVSALGRLVEAVSSAFKSANVDDSVIGTDAFSRFLGVESRREARPRAPPAAHGTEQVVTMSAASPDPRTQCRMAWSRI